MSTLTPLTEPVFFSPDPTKLHYVQKTRYGLMILNKYDNYISQHLSRFGEWSEGEMQALRPLIEPGNVIIDVGANIGAHTLFFAQAVGPYGHVYSFEPQRIPFQALCGNVALNSLLNVSTYHLGLGAYESTLTSLPIHFFQSNNVGGIPLQPESAMGEKVSVKTLDSLPLSECHLIKIDVEGMETHVLYGAFRTIQTFRPYLYIEHHLHLVEHAQAVQAVQAFLKENQYAIFRHDSDYFNPNNFYGVPLQEGESLIQTNILCIPIEKLDVYKPDLPTI